MKSITIYNKGKRTWGLKDADGKPVDFRPETSIEMEEVSGLRLLNDYPREFTSSKIAAPSSEDIARREQSLKDRIANVDAREKALDEREAKIAAMEQGESDTPEPKKRGPGRPKAESTEPKAE